MAGDVAKKAVRGKRRKVLSRGDEMRRKKVPPVLVETQEERKDRLSSSMDMRTRVVTNKKKSRAKQRQEDRKEVDV